MRQKLRTSAALQCFHWRAGWERGVQTCIT